MVLYLLGNLYRGSMCWPGFRGSGFRRMAESLDRVLDAPIRMDIGIPRPRHPMMIPDRRWQDDDGNLYHPTDPPIRI